METMKNNSSRNLTICIICGALTVLGVVASIFSLANGGKGMWVVLDVINLILFLSIGYYAIFAFRKPNGNLLKYILLIYAASYIFPVYSNALMGRPWGSVSYALTIGLLCYIGGRLNREKQNIILMGIATAFILYRTIAGYVNDGATIGVVNHLIIWIDICAAYFFRYKEHKAAGLSSSVKHQL